MRPTHRCAAVDCPDEIPTDRLMCGRHWIMVPGDIRMAYWASYRPGLEADRVSLTPEYMAAVRDAVAAVARAEGKIHDP
jgi:hypothetical protein